LFEVGITNKRFNVTYSILLRNTSLTITIYDTVFFGGEYKIKHPYNFSRRTDVCW